MKANLSRMLRSGVALLLALCMVVGFIPAQAFATETHVKYVSLGDSMTNGYGLPGYDRNSGVEDYGYNSYANQFAEEVGAEHARLAMSAMRAEDLHWILELDYNDADAIALTEGAWDEEAWNAKFSTGDYWTWDEICTHGRTKSTTDAIKAVVAPSFYPATYKGGYDGDVALIAKYFQESVKNADVVSLGMGNGNFGVFMFGRILEAIGFSGTPDDAMVYQVERAIAECDPAMQAKILELKAALFAAVENKIGQKISDNPTLNALANTVVYTGISYALNYAGSVEAILRLTPDAEIILVALMNTYKDDAEVEGITLGDLLDAVFIPLNAYIAALPTVMQAAGNGVYENATFYYAEAPYVECLVDVFGEDFDQGTDSIIRDRFVQSIVVDEEGDAGMVWGLLAGMELVDGVTLTNITLDEVVAYDAMSAAEKATYAATNTSKAVSVAVYLAFEDAILASKTAPVTVDAVMGLGGLGADMFGPIMEDFFANVAVNANKYAADATAAVAEMANKMQNDIHFTPEIVANLVAKNDDGNAFIRELAFANATPVINQQANLNLTVDQVKALYNNDTGYNGAIINAVDTAIATVEEMIYETYDLDGNVGMISTLLALPETLSASLQKDTTVSSLLALFGRCVIGNGLGGHPSATGHHQLFQAVNTAHGEGYTAKDETIQNVTIALDELYKLVETYGPEVAEQVWKQWEEYGYVDAVETSIEELKTMLEERYTYYTETALPAINASVENLSAQKDALTTELEALKAELEAKQAELENVVNNVEIGDIYAPDINIDADLGNNEQTQVPENDCTVDGEDIKAELEAAIKDIEHAIAVIEALIADIEADIADMVALAEQIADAVAELEKTMASLAEAAADVEVAVNAVIDVIKNSDGVVDATVKSFEAARATAEAAVEVLSLTIGTAEEMMADVDAMIEKIAADAEKLYNKFITELPGCIDQIPDEVKMLIGGSVLAVQQAYEANKEEINAALAAELAKLAEEYGINEESIKAELAKLTQEYEANKAAVEAELAAIEAKITEEVNAKYAEVEAEYNAQIEAAKAEAAAKLAELEAELKGYQAELENAAEENKAGIQAQIDRVNADIATVNADLEHAVSHLENAAQEAYEQIVDEVTEVYEETIAALEQKLAELKAAYDEAAAAIEQALAELKAAYDKAVEDLTAEADKAIAELTEALNKALEELGRIGEELGDEVNGILTAIREELAATQKAVEEILKGNLAAIEDLKNALIELGGEAIVDAVEALNDAVMALIEEATTADLVIDDDFEYVAIGDGSAAPESYVEKLTAALNAEAAENGVSEIDMVNNAKDGNTVSAERVNLSDVSGADLITVGFSNVEFLSEAISNMSAGADLDWAAVVGEENVQYVDQLLAEVAAKIAEAGIEGDYAVMANNAIEAYAYATVQYATELPELVNQIHAANPDAVIIIVGMYNPLDGVIINLGDNATLDIGEYVDYLVKGVGVHGVAYSILTGNSIYVDAPAVQTVNTDTELGILDLLTLMLTECASLYPSTEGDDYIAAEIADALNITYAKPEENIEVKHNVTLESYIDFSFFVSKSALAASGLTATITHDRADGYADKSVTLAQTEWESTTVGGVDYWRIRYTDVAAKEMADNLTLTITDVSGTVVTDTYSVAAYAKERIENSANTDMKSLMNAMLHYGAAAQTYFNYKTDNLANVGLTAPTFAGIATTANGSTTVKHNLTLESDINFSFFIPKSSLAASGLTATVCHDRADGYADNSVTLAQAEWESAVVGGVEYWRIRYADVAAKEMSDELTLVITDGTDKVVNDVYSIETYAQERIQNSSNDDMSALMQNLLNYGAAAKTYFGYNAEN